MWRLIIQRERFVFGNLAIIINYRENALIFLTGGEVCSIEIGRIYESELRDKDEVNRKVLMYSEIMAGFSRHNSCIIVE